MKLLLSLLVFFLFSLLPNPNLSLKSVHASVKKAESTEVVTPQLIFGYPEKTYIQDYSYSLTVNAKSIDKVSTLSFDILYEKDVINVSYTSNYLSMDSSSRYDSRIDNDHGVIHVSYIFSENQKLEDSSIFYFSFSVLQTKKTNSYFSLAVTQATDQDAKQIDIKGDFDYFSITENVQTSQDIYIYSSIDKNNAKRNEIITISYYCYSLDTRGAGTFEFTYDRDGFEYFSFTKGDFLSDTSRYSFVKTDIAGSVKVSFASMDTEASYYSYNLFSVSLKVKANIDKQWNFTLEASGLTSKNGNTKYTAPIVTDTIQTIYEQDVSLLPLRYLTSVEDDKNKKLTITLSLEKDSHLSAADIQIDFDPTYLSYSSYKSLVNLSDNPMLGVNTNDVKNGIIKLSWVYLNDLTSKVDFASFEFNILDVVVDTTTSIKVQGSGTRDLNLKQIDLAYQGVDVSLAINKHNWSDWEIVTEATCTTDGLAKRTCTYCNQVETKVLPATAHSYGDWIVDKEPTCTEEGTRHKVCSSCGDVLAESIPMLGHDYHRERKEPTCTEDGEILDVCSRCGEKKTVGVLPATGHSYGEWITDKEPTCTEAGEKHKTCSECGDTVVEALPSLGHDFVHHGGREPTCTEDGWEEYDVCTRCGYSTYKAVPATGHSYGEWVVDKEPTCTEAGEKHRTCSKCGEVLREFIDPLGHDDGRWCVAKEPTCTEDGVEERRCTRCGEVLECRAIGSTGHSYGDWIVDKEPTVDSEGVKSRTCSVCGHKETESIAKLEKNNSGAVVGCIIGGVLGCGLLGMILPYLKKRKKK